MKNQPEKLLNQSIYLEPKYNKRLRERKWSWVVGELWLEAHVLNLGRGHLGTLAHLKLPPRACHRSATRVASESRGKKPKHTVV